MGVPSTPCPEEDDHRSMNFEEICSFEVLYDAYLHARQGKRKKSGCAEYEANALACTEKLSRILLDGSYRPGAFHTFYVFEPKKRLVQAPAFVDKVVLHALVDNELYSVLTHSFIRGNHASQLDKGTHDGLMYLKQNMNRYYRRHGSADGWVMKGDVRHFFASIDHERLKEKLKLVCVRHRVDVRIYELLCVYIDTSDGLPLGYQTSQLLALLYLDEFDHAVQEQYRPEAYGRYMDDFYMIFRTKKEARAALDASRDYMARAKLELNEKTAIFPLRNGIDFIGFHTYLTDTGKVVQKLRRDGIKRIRARVKEWRIAYPKGEISKEKIIERFEAWDAWAAHGDTYKLREKYAKKVSEIIGEEVKPRRKINATRMVAYKRRLKQQRMMAEKTREEPTVSTRVYYAPNQPKEDTSWQM